jgi:ligand-binding sensor domain-containing protein
MRTIISQLLMVFLSFLVGAGTLSAGERLEITGHMGDPSWVSCVTVYQDNLWVGTRGAGMIRWSGGKATYLNEGLPGLRVNDCAVYKGELWVATDSGLASTSTPEFGFNRYTEGRFLKVSSSEEALVAVNDQGLALELTPELCLNCEWHRRTIKLEMVPSALAVHSNEHWAAADLTGLIRVANGPEMEAANTPDGSYEAGLKTYRVPEPVIDLQYEGLSLRIKVPGGGYRIKDGKLLPDPNLAGDDLSLDSEGLALSLPELKGRSVHDVVKWRGANYLATDDGVFKMDGAKLVALPLGGMPCGGRVVSIASFRGALWVGSFDRGLCRLDSNGWTRYQAPGDLPSNRVNDIIATDKHLYVATDLGLAVVDRKGRIVQRTVKECTDDLKRKCPWHASVNGVAVDRRGLVPWMADVGAVHRMRGRQWRRYQRNAGLESQRLTRIAVQDGVVAIGTSDQGIFLKGRRGPFRRYDDQNGLADNWVMDLSFDSAGRLWVATCTKGVSVFEKEHWTHYGTENGLADNYAMAVREINGRMWIGTLSGLTVLGKEGPINLNTLGGLSGNEVHDFVVHKGLVYVATDGGLTLIRVRDDG